MTTTGRSFGAAPIPSLSTGQSERMRIHAQPRRRRGTVGHAYSALNLRLVLAAFGLVTSVIFAVLLFRAGVTEIGWLFVTLAMIAVVDLVVIQLRRRDRWRSGDTNHSLFE